MDTKTETKQSLLDLFMSPIFATTSIFIAILTYSLVLSMSGVALPTWVEPVLTALVGSIVGIQIPNERNK